MFRFWPLCITFPCPNHCHCSLKLLKYCNLSPCFLFCLPRYSLFFTQLSKSSHVPLLQTSKWVFHTTKCESPKGPIGAALLSPSSLPHLLCPDFTSLHVTPWAPKHASISGLLYLLVSVWTISPLHSLTVLFYRSRLMLKYPVHSLFYKTVAYYSYSWPTLPKLFFMIFAAT